MLTFLAGDVVASLSGAGVKLGLEYRLVPLGPAPSHGIYFVDIIARVAMMFGGVAPGDIQRLLTYARERAKAIVIVYPGLTDEEIAFVDGMRVLGFPILSLGDYQGSEWLVSKPDEVVRRGMEERGIRVNVTAIPIPMGCSPAFEGKSIRKEEMYVEFGGGRSPAFEAAGDPKRRKRSTAATGPCHMIASPLRNRSGECRHVMLDTAVAHPLRALARMDSRTMPSMMHSVRAIHQARSSRIGAGCTLLDRRRRDSPQASRPSIRKTSTAPTKQLFVAGAKRAGRRRLVQSDHRAHGADAIVEVDERILIA